MTDENFDVYNYDPVDSSSISNSWIYAITEDHEGDLWIGTKGGLNKYLTKKNRFQRIEYQTGFTFDVTHYIYDVVCLSNGNIIINTPPVISVYNPDKNRFSHFQSNLEYDGAVKDVKIPVLEDDDGRIWIGSAKGLVLFSSKTQEFSYFPFIDRNRNVVDIVNVTALFKDKEGTLWVGTTVGLFHFNSTSKRFEESGFEPTSGKIYPIVNSCIRSFLVDKSGNLIIGTEDNGLYVISHHSAKAAPFITIPLQTAGLLH